MPTVAYERELDYLRDRRTGSSFPGLWLVVRGLRGQNALEIQAHLDSGTERTLLDGQVGKAIGLDLHTGGVIHFRSATGALLTARLHPVVLAHDDLGERELTVAFSEASLARNLLGRDYFNLFQIGFRERQFKILVTPEQGS